jgi:hypothetical protein
MIGRTTQIVRSLVINVLVAVCYLASRKRAGDFEGVEFGMNAFALPHLGHYFFSLLRGEFGILRFDGIVAHSLR